MKLSSSFSRSGHTAAQAPQRACLPARNALGGRRRAGGGTTPASAEFHSRVSPQDWQYQKDLGYVNASSLERKSPEEFYKYGVQLAREGRIDESVSAFRLIVRHGPDPELMERAFFKHAEAYWSGGRYEDAHHAYASFAMRYPDSERAEEAKKQGMWCALRVAEIGEVKTILGFIPIGRSSKAGVQLLRDFLARYPREKFSAQYHFLLGEFLRQDEQLDEAVAEFTRLTERYPGSPYAAQGLIRLAEVQLQRFEGLDYDVKPLRDAREYYLKFLDQYAAADAERVEKVKAEIARIEGLQAEKEFRIAEYYLSRGYPDSAALYFRVIVKRFPATEWAAKAKDRLSEIGQGK